MKASVKQAIAEARSNVAHFPDFRFVNHGTFALLHPITQRAKQWIADLPAEAVRWNGAVAVEHRNVLDLANAIHDLGLNVRLEV